MRVLKTMIMVDYGGRRHILPLLETSSPGPSGIPGIPGSWDFNPGIFETEIPGFVGIFCHHVLDPLERSYAKNRQNCPNSFSLFIGPRYTWGPIYGSECL